MFDAANIRTFPVTAKFSVPFLCQQPKNRPNRFAVRIFCAIFVPSFPLWAMRWGAGQGGRHTSRKAERLCLIWFCIIFIAPTIIIMGENNDITHELALLHTLDGGAYSRQVEHIAHRGEFYPLKGEELIYVCGGENDTDYRNLLNAAHKAVFHGYKVYILPNPKGLRTPDFIFESKGIYRVYDLKTIIGKNSAGNRLRESIGQANRVLLNMRCEYKAKVLALDILSYFEASPDAREVLVFKGRKHISVKRNFAMSKQFLTIFRRLYEK